MENVPSPTSLSPGTAELEEEGCQMYLGQKCRLTGVLRVQGMMRNDG